MKGELRKIVNKIFDLRIKLKRGKVVTDDDLWSLQLSLHELVDRIERIKKKGPAKI